MSINTSKLQCNLTGNCRLAETANAYILLPVGGDLPESLDAAIASRTSSLVKSVLENDPMPTQHSLNLACLTRDEEIVKLIVKAGAIPSSNTLILALRTRNQKIVKLVAQEVIHLVKFGFDASPGALTVACESLRPVEDMFIHDWKRDKLIKAVARASEPDEQTLITFLKNSVHSHFSKELVFFCQGDVLNALEDAGIQCTGSEEETACILDSCLRLDSDCREDFCAFLMNIGFDPTEQQMQTYFHDPVDEILASYAAEKDQRIQTNIAARLMHIAHTLDMLKECLSLR